uniref:Zinc finger-containing ubiquitin peptidase 1 n=1 Tax=Clastoptera arizonana TaxID=38151 RepID=A0A1B6CYF8_9HEMI
MAAKMPELNYSCEICGTEGLSDEEMRMHIVVCHLKGAASCPFCDLEDVTAEEMLTHVNTAHLDYLTPEQELLSFIDDEEDSDRSESVSHWDFSMKSQNESPSGLYSCPICAQSFHNTPDLELHVNIEHKDILSPTKYNQEPEQVEKMCNICPICCMTNFKTTEDLGLHIEDHFNQKVITPLTPDVSCDRLLAREIEKKDKEMRRLREQHEFELLRAQYGMDNEGNFKEQSLTNMQRAVYSGELSVADYYERQIELRMAESSGIDDSSSCTKDIVPLIMTVSRSCTNVGQTLMCTTVDHYGSTYGDKGWGCGYRNMQMMLSSLLHHTGYNEQLYKQWVVGGPIRGEMPSRSAMPSISRLQQHIEWAWGQGFDVQGCDQLGGKLFNTRKWIGATEVVTVLSSLRIRCELIDFHRPTSASGSHPELFNWVLEYFQANDDFKPPLYLQHQGHSRTIVGVEQLKDGTVFLLLLDPSHSPHQMAELRNTSSAMLALRLIRKSLAAMKAKHYQIVAICGIMDNEIEYQQSKVLRSMRVPQER